MAENPPPFPDDESVDDNKENVKLDPSIFTEHGSDSSDTDAEEAKVENNVFYEGIFPMEEHAEADYQPLFEEDNALLSDHPEDENASVSDEAEMEEEMEEEAEDEESADDEETGDADLMAELQMWKDVRDGIIPVPAEVAEGRTLEEQLEFVNEMIKSYLGEDEQSDYEPSEDGDDEEFESGESSGSEDEFDLTIEMQF